MAIESLARQEARRRISKKAEPSICRAWRAAPRWMAITGKQLARFADTKRLRYPDRGLRIPNGWNDPAERFRQGADKFWEATLALASL